MIISKFGRVNRDEEDYEADVVREKHTAARLNRVKNMAAVHNTTIRCGQGYKGCDCNRCKYANKSCPKIKVIYRKKG